MKTMLPFISLLLFHFCIKAQGINRSILAQHEQIKEDYQFPDDAWLISTEGDTIFFESLKGQWTILDYWSAGCKPCIEAFPVLNRIYVQGGLNVIGINVDKDFARFEKYHKKYRIEYPDFFGGFALSNELMLANLKIVASENTQSKLVTLTPQYILLNPQGVIVNMTLPKPGTAAFDTIIERIKQ